MLKEFETLGPAEDVGPKGEPMGGSDDPYRPLQPGEQPPVPGQPPAAEPPPPPEPEPPPVAAEPEPAALEAPEQDPIVAALQAKVAMYEQMLRGATAPGAPGQPGLPPGMATPTAQPGQPPLPGQPAPLPTAPITPQPPAQQAQPSQPIDYLGGRDHRDMTPDELNYALEKAMAIRDQRVLEQSMHRNAEVSQAVMAQMASNTMAYENHLNAPGNEWIKENQAAFDWELQTTQNMYPHLAHDMATMCQAATQSLRARNPNIAQGPPAARPQTTAPKKPNVPRVAPAAQTRTPAGAPKTQGQQAYMADFMEGFTPEGM